MITEADVASDVRRRAYLELTLLAVWFRLGLLGVLAVAVGRGLPLVFLAMALVAGLYLVRGEGGLRRRMRLRAWLVAAVWLQLVWAVPLVGSALWDYLLWETSLLGAYDDDPAMAATAAAGIAAAVGPLLWWVSWRRSCRILGIPRRAWYTQRERRAVLLAFAPQGGIVVLVATVSGVLYALDTYWPTWYMY